MSDTKGPEFWYTGADKELFLNPDHPDLIAFSTADLECLRQLACYSLTEAEIADEWKSFSKQVSNVNIKLNRENYHTWKLAIQSIFQVQPHQRILRLMSRTIAGHPIAYRWYGGTPPSGSTRSKVVPDLLAPALAMEMWTLDDTNLGSFLIKTLTEEMYSFATPSSDAYSAIGGAPVSGSQLWSKLEARYKEQGAAMANSIKREIVATRQGSLSVRALADKFDELFLRYHRATSCVFPETDQVNAFLAALDNDHIKPFIGSITRQLDDGCVFTFPALVAKAVAEESLYKPQDNAPVTGHPISMAAQQRAPLGQVDQNRQHHTYGSEQQAKGDGNGHGSGQPPSRCTWCRNRNHTSDECHVRMAGYPPSRDNPNNRGNHHNNGNRGGGRGGYQGQRNHHQQYSQPYQQGQWAAAAWTPAPHAAAAPWPSAYGPSYQPMAPMMMTSPTPWPQWPYPPAPTSTPSPSAQGPAMGGGMPSQFGMAMGGGNSQPYNQNVTHYTTPSQGTQSHGSAFAFTPKGTGPHPFFGQ